jgi:hypothetical protein
MTPELSIVVVGFNAADELEACLDALVSHPASIPHEIILVDNASSDDGPARVAARFPMVRVVRNPVNVGFARGCNAGLRQAAGRRWLLLNPDTLVRPGAIDGLVRALEADPRVAAVGPRIISGDGRVELSWGRVVSPWTEAAQKILVTSAARGAGWAVRRVERLTASWRVVDWITGACLLVRADEARAVGLLDERFFMYLEDVDFCAALRARGRLVVFDPSVTVVHHRGRSTATALEATRLAYRRSQLAFYDKHHPRWVPWLRTYLRLRGQLPPSTGP